MTTPAPNYYQINRPPDITYVKWGLDRWDTQPTTSWVDVPDASIKLDIGSGTSSYGAYFVATFSAEALCESPDDNNVLAATVFFGNKQADPASGNHRYATARGRPEWSSHTLIRTVQFDPSMTRSDVTARVKVVLKSGNAGLQNWLLKVERYNL